MRTYSFTNTTRHTIPRVPFLRIKEKVMGKSYDLSVVIVTPTYMKKLNTTYRKKTKATDVLSFTLSKTSGEIYLCVEEIKKRSPLYGLSYPKYLGYLFIHGLLHLKGMDHGRTMEKLEHKYCTAFQLSTPK